MNTPLGVRKLLTVGALVYLGVSLAVARVQGDARPAAVGDAFVSTSSGNWSAMAWSAPGTPGPTDNVIIADGHTVIIDQNISVGSITIGQGTSGVLTFDGAAARTVVVTGNVTVDAGGTFIAQSAGAYTNTMTLGGDLTNNGVFDMSRGSASTICNVTFSKAGTQTVSGSGSVTRFRGIALEKGSVSNKVICSMNASMAGSSLFVFTAGTWEQTAGTLSVTSGNQTIGAGGSLIISGTAGYNASVASSLTVNGNLTVNTSGTFVQGNGNNKLLVTGNALFASGTVNIFGQLQLTAGNTTIDGAAINIDPQAGSPLSGTAHTFEISGTANVTFSSGSVTLVDPIAIPTSGRDLTIGNTTGSVDLSGGTFYFGDGVSSTTGASGFQISNNTTAPIPLGNLVLRTGGAPGRDVRLMSNLTIDGALTLTSGAILLGEHTLSYGAAGTLVYNGTASQTTSDAEFPASNGPVNLTINNAAGVNLHSSRTINGVLTFTAGKLATGAETVVLGVTAGIVGAGEGRYVHGNLARAVPSSGSPTLQFDIGDLNNYAPISVAFNNLSAGGRITASTTGVEHPSISGSGIDPAKSVNRYWTLTNNGVALDHYDVTLNFVLGDVDAAANTSNFQVKKYDNGTWTSPTTSNPQSTSIQATGMATFGDFAVGEVSTFTISGMVTDGTNPLENVTVTASGGFTGHAMTDASGAYAISSVPKGATGIVLTPSLVGYTFSPSTRTVNDVLGNVTGEDFTGASSGFWITTVAGPNGSITPSIAVPAGSDQTITMTPSVGYHVATLTVDGTGVEPVTSYTFMNVQAPHTIAATFAQSNVPVSAANTQYNLDNNGDGMPDMKITFSVLPSSGGTVNAVVSPVTPTGSPAPLSGALPYYLRLSSSMANFSFRATLKIDMSGVSGFGPNSYLMYYNGTTASWVMVSGTYAASDAEFGGHPSYAFVTDHFTPFTFITSSTTPMDLYVSSSVVNTSANIVYPNNTWRPEGPTYHGADDWLWPASQQISVYIVPAAGTLFGACNVSLEWDGSVLSYGSVDFGTAGNPNGLFGTGQSYPIMSPQVLRVGNHVTISCSRLDNGNFFTGAGDYVAKVNFTIVRCGHSVISIIGADLEQLSGIGAPVRTHVIPTQAEAKVYLGDFASPGNTSTGDGKIDINDLSVWSISYWSGTPTLPSLANYKVKYDIGPTENGYAFSLPVPDNKIDFEDLVVFSISFGLSSMGHLPKRRVPSREEMEISLGTSMIIGAETRIPVVLGGAIADVRAIKLEVEGLFETFLGAEKGELLKSYTTPVVLMSQAQGRRVSVDLAVLGLDADGLSRAGEVVVLRFLGKPHVHLRLCEARSSGNVALNVQKVKGAGDSEPISYALLRNYPNPFNPATTIEYELPETGQVELSIYDALGEKVATLVKQRQEAGVYRVQWDGRDRSQRRVASGVYFYRVQVGEFKSVNKMLMVK